MSTCARLGLKATDMSSIEMEEKLAYLDEDIQRLTEKIVQDQSARSWSAQSAADFQPSLRVTRNLEGHFGKIYSMQWGPDSKRIVSAGQDGKLIVWQANFGVKHHMINLRSSWVMCCAYSPDGRTVASGGLDNICAIYSVPDQPAMSENKDAVTPPKTELAQHLGYLSCIRYMSASKLLTSSGDSTIILWDLANAANNGPDGASADTFAGHKDDVMCVCLVDDTPNVFLSGSVDTTAKLWDTRVKRSVLTFYGHDSDVNCVAALPGGNSFVTACEDAAVRLFDIRAQACVAVYKPEAAQGGKQLVGVTSVAPTKSGRGIVASYDHETIMVWDTLKGVVRQELNGHSSRVAAVDVSPDGKALCSASWDNLVKVWA